MSFVFYLKMTVYLRFIACYSSIIQKVILVKKEGRKMDLYIGINTKDKSDVLFRVFVFPFNPRKQERGPLYGPKTW